MTVEFVQFLSEKLMKLATLLKSTLACAALSLAVASPSQALTLTPGGTTCTSNTNSNLSEAQIEALVLSCFGLVADLSEAYKADVGDPVVESGPFAGSYQTSFFNDPLDPADALIEYISGAAIACPYCFLVVKDGNQEPAQYIFALGLWNGTDDIELLGFWPNQGAISHISIYNGRLTEECARTNPFCIDIPVPEPGSLALLGIGALGLALRRRFMA